jgi:uncharacterized alpha-E superfamily protein
MLSRTADNLFWTARYIERADLIARILDASTRLAALPTSYGGASVAWESAIASAGVAQAFYARYGDADEASVREFLAFSPDNPSSIRCCLDIARSNARAVRTALTMEMWEAINDAWNDLSRRKISTTDQEDFTRYLDGVKAAALAFDGSARRTMLRNDAYWFLRLGGAIERADNTARILDVKYHVLLPEREAVGGGLDYFQWTTILREVSALTAYHWVYRENVKPWLVADLLILNRQMPRSLASCYDVIVHHTDLLAEAYGRRGPSQRHARSILSRLAGARIEDIFQSGLHEFISAFLSDNARMGQTIAEQYLL